MHVLLSEMTRPDVEQAIAQGRMVIIPVGSVEQHGPHLPLDTDITNSFEISKSAAKNVGALVAPPLYYGISPHWMGYAGTISIDQRTFIDFLTQICTSLVKHGFKRVVILNGHGGNTAATELVAQNVAESNSQRCLVASLSYWDVSSEAISALRQSPYGGMGHACELETSLQLYLRGNLVRMERAVRNIQKRTSEFQRLDLADPRRGPLIYVVGGGGASGKPKKIGIMGDPTLASRDKGKKFFDKIAEQVTKFLKDLSQVEI